MLRAMISRSNGNFRFVQTRIAANPELITDFSPPGLASFTMGWLDLGNQMPKGDVPIHFWHGIRDIYNSRLKDIETPQILQGKRLPGITLELQNVSEDETLPLQKIVHCWPKFIRDNREVRIRLDHIWTPSSDLALEQPAQYPEITEEPSSPHHQVESLFDGLDVV